MSDHFTLWEEELFLSVPAESIVEDHREILSVARMVVEDAVAMGYPRHIAERHGQRIVDAYFDALKEGRGEGPSH